MDHTQNEIFNSLSNFLLEINTTNNFIKMELYITLNNDVLGLSGKSFSIDGKVASLKTKPNEDLKTKIRYLKKIPFLENNASWNRAKFSITKEGKFNIKFKDDNKLTNGVDDFDWESL